MVAYINVSINDFPDVCFRDDDAVYGGCCVGHYVFFSFKVAFL